MSAPGFSPGLVELAEEINLYVAGWHDFGYETPPAPDCKAIPPLGQRSAQAIKYGHEAIAAIDRLFRELHALRSQLVGELRQNDDLNADRADALLGRLREERQS